VVWYVVYWVV